MSRKEKFGNSQGTSQQEKAAQPSSIGMESNELEALPPRRKKISIKRSKSD